MSHSPHSLIGKFSDTKRAIKARDDLDELLLDLTQTYGFAYTRPTKKMVATGKKLGFDWTDGLEFGIEEIPDTVRQGEMVVVFHEMCGGFGESFSQYFEARGAEKVITVDTPPVVKVTAKLLEEGDDSETLCNEVETFLTTPDSRHDPWRWRAAPWGGNAPKSSEQTQTTWQRKSNKITFSLPLHPVFLNPLRHYLEKGTKEHKIGFVGI